MDLQRYVSPDLTHFVGRRHRTLTKQYAVLKAILREGRLRAPKPNGFGRVPYVLHINASARLSENSAYRPSMICFCDIPLATLASIFGMLLLSSLAKKQECE